MGIQAIEVLKPQITSTDEGDHDRFAHYVIGGTAAILEAMVTGIPCEALCGKKWVPSRDPQRYPVCPECETIKADRGL